MAPIDIKYVVSFSSQDENHQVSNIVKSNRFKRWLSNPNDKTGQMEAVFQLEDFCSLEFIDVGSYWCATLQILVGRSDWPQGMSFKTLVPTTCIMPPIDCKAGNNLSQTKMFQPDDFCQDVSGGLWDRIQVVCRQPFRRDVQFGLSFLHIRSKTTGDGKIDMSPIQKNVQSIQKHFGLANMTNKYISKNSLKSKLLKIAGSSENGSFKRDSLSRTANLVLRATEDNVKTNPWAKTPQTNRDGLFSDHIAQKSGPTFQNEVDVFLKSLEIDKSQLDHVTIADLRHKLEKRKKRKLTVEEKKVFKRKSTNYIYSLFNEEDIQSETIGEEDIQSETIRDNGYDNFESNSSQDLCLKLELAQKHSTQPGPVKKSETKENSMISSYLSDVAKTSENETFTATIPLPSCELNGNLSECKSDTGVIACIVTSPVLQTEVVTLSPAMNRLKTAEKNITKSFSRTNKRFNHIFSDAVPTAAKPVSPMGILTPTYKNSFSVIGEQNVESVTSSEDDCNEVSLPHSKRQRSENCLPLFGMSDEEVGSVSIFPTKRQGRGRGRCKKLSSSSRILSENYSGASLPSSENCLSMVGMSDKQTSDEDVGPVSSFATKRRGRRRGQGKKLSSSTRGKNSRSTTQRRGKRRGNNRRNTDQVSSSLSSIALSSIVTGTPVLRQSLPTTPVRLDMAYCNHCEGNFPESDFPHHFVICPGKSTAAKFSDNRSNMPSTSWTTNYFGSMTAPLTLVECPICGVSFSADRIEVHAAVCLEV